MKLKYKTIELLNYFQMARIDLIDDLKMAGKDSFQEVDRPTFQGLRQEGVVCVGKGIGTDKPRLVPAKIL